MNTTLLRHTDLFLIFLFYIIGDIISTHYALHTGYEGNTYVNLLLNSNFGITALITAKILFFMLVIYTKYYILKYNYPRIWKTLAIFLILFGIILTVNNICVIYFGLSPFQHLWINHTNTPTNNYLSHNNILTTTGGIINDKTNM